MRSIKKQLSMWGIVLVVGGTAIAIPVATRFSPAAIAVVTERPDHLNDQTTAHNEDADAEPSKDSKAVIGPGVAAPQDYYDRRRQYWEKRVERELDDEDEQDGDDKDDADAKDSKKGKDDEDDEDDEVEQEIEQRREYWRKRVERDW